MFLKILVITVAALAAMIRLPPAWVERIYSRELYPAIQARLTPASNLVPLSLLDIFAIALLFGLIAWWFARRRQSPGRRRRAVPARFLDILAVAAVAYLVFLVTWGLNYQREPLAARIDFDRGRVTSDALHRLAAEAVTEINSLYAPAHGPGWPELEEISDELGPAFIRAQASLGGPPVVPGRPKRSLLNFYFTRAAVDGMTDPFFLEILVRHDLLPFERPFVVAHEWAHLAGYADESEAAFVGWLTCLRGNPSANYSGWLFLYLQIAGSLEERDRAALDRRLGPGPRADLDAMLQQYRRTVFPRARAFSRVVYDRFLKANRVRAGIQSYDAVVTLILGTRFTDGYVPVVKTFWDLRE